MQFFQKLSDLELRSRGAPDSDPDPAGYPVNFVDPVRIRIRPDPETVDPVEIRINCSAVLSSMKHIPEFDKYHHKFHNH